MHARLRILWAAVVLGQLLAACSAVPAVPLPSAADQRLVSVTWDGGECRMGPCTSTVRISTAGRVRRNDGPAVEVPQPMMAALADAIRATDFRAVLARPFTGSCPTEVDGQEVTYAVATPSGDVEIASCTVEVDPSAPLFTAIGRITELAPFPG